ncbi:MAG: pyridoxamine 5'-phosphate oxidase family protein [bacterium]|nr:pyridoxamine 5'-phosphate oxidase family protein [bacterium]
MRRKDKEIQDRGLIDKIMAQAQVCRLGLCKDNAPYVVPVSFGYDGAFIYFHTAREGMKLDYLASNNRVCFELEHDVKVIPSSAEACEWSVSFYSVIGFGTVEEIVDPPSKVHAVNQIMKHYSGREWNLDERSLEKTRLWRILIERITGKRSKDKIALQESSANLAG